MIQEGSKDSPFIPPSPTECELILTIAKRCGFVPLCMKVAARRKRISTWEVKNNKIFQSDIGPSWPENIEDCL
jgi:hypothetical protein